MKRCDDILPYLKTQLRGQLERAGGAQVREERIDHHVPNEHYTTFRDTFSEQVRQRIARRCEKQVREAIS
jgi:hypothetical protein